MNRAKIFVTVIFLLVFAFQGSSQDKTRKIVWKNLQEKYERFQAIKPIITNASDQPIYFDCSFKDGDFLSLSYNFRLLKFYDPDKWGWNIMVCGTRSKEEIKEEKNFSKQIEKLKKQGKYVQPLPYGCKLNPGEEFPVNFSEEQWTSIISGDFEVYKSGEYKFELNYGWIASENFYAVSSSPEFSVSLKEEIK